MMQRKKPTTTTTTTTTTSTFPSTTHDDNSKQHKPRAPPTPSLKTTCTTLICLPGIPAPIKLVLGTFLSFAALMVLTAKDHHAVFHYGLTRGGGTNGIAGRHGMPEPLRVSLKKRMAHHKHQDSSNTVHDSKDSSISFVESEKRLKKQLLKLLELQNAERAKYHGKNPNDGDSVLGIPIANRYLGPDLLPYPKNRGDKSSWEKTMEARKEELKKADETKWKDLMAQYEEAMESIILDSPSTNESKDETHKQQLKSWPPPSSKAGPNTTILLQPVHGTHNPSSNAIFVFAEGYDLSIYLSFFESLSATGYTGDVVISISTEKNLKPGVKEYLTSVKQMNIVVYEVEWTCQRPTGEKAHGSNEGSNHCQMVGVYGNKDGGMVDDPREARPVATARYELYWMWSLMYDGGSWIMLIDARDTWFQREPFGGLGGGGDLVEGGELHFFGENADAVRIGTSGYNRRWLISAYGEENVKQFFEEPVICSGSTIGNKVAIESYLRAMVAQFDSTLCKSKGCDQGFHNYLYYSGQLGSLEPSKTTPIATGIKKVIVHVQGTSIINNLGALREKPLSEWGLYDADKELVLNWDKSVSAVAHQYDRDKEVNIMVKKKKRLYEQHLKEVAVR